jgi:peptide/nickel transport system ATP-binding protein
MASQFPVLRVENLSVCYQVGKQWIPAVRDFRMEVQAGEIYGIVGESGSGKSTVATAVMGYLAANGRIEPDSRIEFMGEDMTRLSRPQMRRLWGTRIKMVPQNPAAALNPAMKVGEQVAEVVRYNLGWDVVAARQAVLEIFRKVQLVDPESVLGRYPHELSGGMQQRILIAMALITQPQLLVMDEPTTGLDVTTEAVILDLIRQLAAEQEDTGVIYVTHNLGVVAQLCERVTVMYGGEVMADGKVRDLYRNPLHPYTIGLLNSIPRPGRTKRDAALQSIQGSPPSLLNIPTGCVFADRCPVAIDKCRTYKPPLEKIDDGRSIRCHRWGEIASGALVIQPSEQAGVQDNGQGTVGTALRLEGITKHFPVAPSLNDLVHLRIPPPIRAVDGINLSIRCGRTMGLVGESGSGKTTLSRVIIGLQDRTDGKIDLMGVDLAGDVQRRSREVLAKLQMVFQNPQESLNPYLTVGQAIRRPLMKLRGMSRKEADQEVLHLLEAVNLRREYVDRYPAELSGGEKQRVAIARAFASDPDLVICDEPVSALDVSVQAAVLNLLARLQAENGTSYLFITHDLAVVGYLADYIAVMYLGQLFEVGYARQVFSPPFHPYTEALLSAIPLPDPDQGGGRVLLKGEIPSARHLPAGCRFHTRCPHKIGKICEEQEPPWRDNGEDHFIRCHIPLDELAEMQMPLWGVKEVEAEVTPP